MKRTDHIKQLVNSIPEEMKKYKAWVLVPIHNKKPHQINGLDAKINDPSTWYTFDECLKELEECEDWLYLAFAFSENDPFCFVDIDEIGTERCKVTQGNFMDVVKFFNSYTEVSRSGAGVHIVGYGSCEDKWWKKNNDICFEMYSKNHFMTFTGVYVDDFLTLNNIKPQMSALQRKHPKKHVKREVGESVLSEQEIYAKIQRGTWLILSDGGTLSGDESGADYSLLCKIAELSNNDPNVMENVFGMTIRGQREKWKTRADYRERTINSVLNRGN